MTRSLRLHALAGLLILAAAALAYNFPRLAPGAFNWAEPGNVGAALAEGRGFSDPFAGNTGPTAWVPPLPAWIDATVFLFLGVKTAAAAKAFLILAVLGLAATHALLLVTLAPGGVWLQRVAAGAFLAGAIFIPGGPLVVRSEAWLVLLLSIALLAAALAHRRQPGSRATAALIAVAVLAPLTHAGLALATAVVLLTLAACDLRARAWRVAPYAAAVAAALAIGAWTTRNLVTLGRIVPLKSNFWFELHLANVASPDGLVNGGTVMREMPFFEPGQFERYARLGELAYIDSFREPTRRAIAADPAHFAGNILRRAQRAFVYCFTDDGTGPAHVSFANADAVKLAQARELLLLDAKAGRWRWTGLDAAPEEARARFSALGLTRFNEIWRDWAEARLVYDNTRYSLRAFAAGFAIGGAPVLALLAALVAGRGRLGREAAWAVLIAGTMIAPFVIINHNPRQQSALLALQAVAFGVCVQAWADRRSARAVPPTTS